MSETVSDNGKTVAIVSYLTLIGWIVAFIMHNNNKTELGAYHLRQMLGLLLLGITLSIIARVVGIPVVVWVLQIGVFALWIMGLIGAFNGEKKPVPLLGEQFQQWFKGIG
ncbi:hypothetical protein KXJ69_07775 [Aureisphaera sp. CAU 1614]|uniref:DUF4870 domain-containing protein n=1 Tax=Halomarinibacterium sedimenti TaxID=2857106 RepID=A0A9X1JVQ1_9FLAO|nr:hypothetical protein [Halomarinibacterium sedimenti]MBW2938000.1 hypothetical protein [Halomarinibacterium sedimenti]